jgi:hypothetical protein
MANESEFLLGVAAAVADGTPVDWPSLEGQAATDDERRLLVSLRLLSQVGTVHDTADADAASATISAQLPAASTRAAAVTTPHVGRWGRYELREKIGEGGQGAVYRAWDSQLECEIALKVLQPHYALVDRIGSRILREGRALARVRHPNVVNVYGVETHEAEIGLCMEFIRGRTLEEVLRAQGALSASEAVTIGVAVGRALAAVHAAGIVHRDVKARNVMREEKGRIVLMDFGTGQDHVSAERGGSADLAGTPLYMAPEVLSGSAASQQSDIYSVGVLLYHLVTGRYPVEGRTFEQIVEGHRTGRSHPLAERRPDLPDGFIRVVDRATSRDPSARYESVALLVHDLVALEASDVDRVAPPRTAAQQVVRWGAVLAMCVLGAALLGFVNSMAFNVTLERTEVAGETPRDWLEWGVRSLIGPIVWLAFRGIVVAMLIMIGSLLWKAVRKVWPALDVWAIRVSATVGPRVRVWSHEPDTFGQLACIASLVYLVVISFTYQDLIGAIITIVSHMTDHQRAVLSPTSEGMHDAYRSWLDLLVVGSGLSIYWLARLRQRRATKTSAAWLATLGSVFALATVLWTAPYRLLYQAEFSRITVESQRCYDLVSPRLASARAGDQVLIYCPNGPQPKVRRVSTSAVRDTGITESVFTLD